MLLTPGIPPGHNYTPGKCKTILSSEKKRKGSKRRKVNSFIKRKCWKKKKKEVDKIRKEKENTVF